MRVVMSPIFRLSKKDIGSRVSFRTKSLMSEILIWELVCREIQFPRYRVTKVPKVRASWASRIRKTICRSLAAIPSSTIAPVKYGKARLMTLPTRIVRPSATSFARKGLTCLSMPMPFSLRVSNSIFSNASVARISITTPLSAPLALFQYCRNLSFGYLIRPMAGSPTVTLFSSA